MVRKLALSVLVLAALLVLAEVGARVWVTRLAGDEAFLRYASLDQLGERHLEGARLVPHRYLGYAPNPGWSEPPDRINALGYRGDDFPRDKPAGELRVACLGGSTTYTTFVPDPGDAYPAQLEQSLRDRGVEGVRVINAGVPGWSSWESLLSFELRVLDVDPDVVIVYHGVNDVHPRLVWPPEAYRGDNSGYLRAVDPMFLPGVLEYSTLARIALVASGRTAPHSSLHRTLKGYAPTYHGDAFFRQKARGSYPAKVFAETPAAEMLRVNDPRYLVRNLRNLCAAARAHGVRPVLATFAFTPEGTDEVRATAAEYLDAYREQNELVRALGEELGVPVLDLAAVLTDPIFFVDGRHVNEEGARIKGELFAEFLLGHRLLER